MTMYQESKVIDLNKFNALNEIAPSNRVSTKYSFLNTRAVVDGLIDIGFTPVAYSEVRSRNADTIGKGGHIVSLTHPNLISADKTLQYRILLKSAHDGTSSFTFYFGVFRFVCANGLVVNSNVDLQRYRHVGVTLAEVKQGALDFVAEKAKVIKIIDAMRSTNLNVFDASAFAAKVIHTLGLQCDQAGLLGALRIEDKDDTVWNIFNRIQEKIMRGGLSYLTTNKKGKLVTRTSRKIKAINRGLKVNRQLWDIAESYIDVKQAA